VTDDLGGGHRPEVTAPPGLQQVVQDRVELLLRWVPRLEEVVVEVDDVDRVDRAFVSAYAVSSTRRAPG
jgi:hypothetical protein